MRPELPVVPDGLDDGMPLDSIARDRPMARGLLLVDLLRARPVPIDLVDSLVEVREFAEWKSSDTVDSGGEARWSQWPLRTPRAGIRPVAACDFASIHTALNDPTSSWRLPTRGTTVLPGVTEQILDGADLQMVGVANRHPTVPVALMALNGYDPVDQVADLTVIGLERDEAARRRPRPHRAIRLEVLAMFVSHAFTTMNLHRITASVPEFNWPYFADGEGVFFESEGVRREQMLVAGRRWDLHQIAISRAGWHEVEQWLVPAFERFVPDR